uniref:Uncharacterized protein n=1 Tax=Romanomermis culicivorax TaxID=13658 RepID=A0A915HMX3_ROMCU
MESLKHLVNDTPKEYFELVMDVVKIIKNSRLINEQLVSMTYCQHDDFAEVMGWCLGEMMDELCEHGTTKIAGKDADSGRIIIGEEGYDATKIVKEEVTDATKIVKEEGIDGTKLAGESGDASEDQKAVSVQTTFVNELFIDYLKDPDYDSRSDTSSK